MRNPLWASAYSLPSRRLAQRYTHPCSITDTASAANTPPAMSSRNSALSMIATVPSAPPMAREPVSHEHLGRMRVEPQKPQCRAGEGAAEDRQLLGAGEEVHEEVARPVDAAEYVRKCCEGAREDGRQAGRETVQPVGEVHGVRATGHDDRDEEEIQWRRQHQQHVLEHRQLSR